MGFRSSISDIAGKDAEKTTNERGGSQSHIPTRFDLFDGKAMFEMAAVLHEGAEKYGEDNWRLIPIEDHLNHALMHIFAYLAGDESDDHLSHIMCRAMFAQGVALQDEVESDSSKEDKDYVTTSSCKYCGGLIDRNVVNGIPGHWVHTSTRRMRCHNNGTKMAEPSDALDD